MRIFSFGPVAFVVLQACGSPNDPKDPSVTECGELAKPASDKVRAVIEANRSCSADPDCMTIAVHSACFDQCSTPIASTGRSAVEQALESVSANECKDFTAASCKLIVPPCAPPTPPTCRAGQCS